MRCTHDSSKRPAPDSPNLGCASGSPSAVAREEWKERVILLFTWQRQGSATMMKQACMQGGSLAQGSEGPDGDGGQEVHVNIVSRPVEVCCAISLL